LCLSGRYEVSTFTNGFQNADVYFNNPLAFVPNLGGAALDRTRQAHLTLVCGRGPFEEGCIEETVALGRVLRDKQIPSDLDIWGTDSKHDWPWWRRQLLHHAGRMF
jgi:esterase/lipase superfamily enzyme